MKLKSLIACVFILSLVLTSCAGGGTSVPEETAEPEPAASRAIVLGDISDDPAEVIEGAQPLADYLASQLGEFGITEGKVRVVSSTDEMAKLLASGEVDLYFDSAYPATLISDQTGARIILRRWRFGVEEYQSVIFASAASGITSLDQLPGHIVAMDAPYSTSGFLLPSVLLIENGFTLGGKRRYDEPVAPGEIGFAFSYDDENTLQWVLNGFAAAGVTDDFHFDVAFPEEARSQLVELARTESTPRQVALVRPGLDEDLVRAIAHALITMHEAEAGAAALKPFQTSKFDEFPEGIESATARMREMMELVKDIRLP